MSDMLQLVVRCGRFNLHRRSFKNLSDALSRVGDLLSLACSIESTAPHDKLKHIGHSWSHSCCVPTTAAHDKLKRIGHSLSTFDYVDHQSRQAEAYRTCGVAIQLVTSS